VSVYPGFQFSGYRLERHWAAAVGKGKALDHKTKGDNPGKWHGHPLKTQNSFRQSASPCGQILPVESRAGAWVVPTSSWEKTQVGFEKHRRPAADDFAGKPAEQQAMTTPF